MNKLQVAVFLLFAAACVLMPDEASAQMNCRVSVTTLAFGNYLPADTGPLDSSGSIDVSCRGQAGVVLVAISTGSSGTYSFREMQSGIFRMIYNLYLDAGRTLIWGDGTGGSLVNSRIKPSNGRQDFSIPVYGRAPAQQSVGAGLYVDDVIVTVYF